MGMCSDLGLMLDDRTRIDDATLCHLGHGADGAAARRAAFAQQRDDVVQRPVGHAGLGRAGEGRRVPVARGDEPAAEAGVGRAAQRVAPLVLQLQMREAMAGGRLTGRRPAFTLGREGGALGGAEGGDGLGLLVQEGLVVAQREAPGLGAQPVPAGGEVAPDARQLLAVDRVEADLVEEAQQPGLAGLEVGGAVAGTAFARCQFQWKPTSRQVIASSSRRVAARAMRRPRRPRGRRFVRMPRGQRSA